MGGTNISVLQSDEWKALRYDIPSETHSKGSSELCRYLGKWALPAKRGARVKISEAGMCLLFWRNEKNVSMVDCN